jgi:replicative DNA helicase
MEEPKAVQESKNSGLSVVRNKVNGPEYGKLPPQAVDLEEAVLGALMLDKEALTDVIDILKKESFYKEDNQLIYESILSLFEKSEPIDILTVTQELKKQLRNSRRRILYCATHKQGSFECKRRVSCPYHRSKAHTAGVN